MKMCFGDTRCKKRKGKQKTENSNILKFVPENVPTMCMTALEMKLTKEENCTTENKKVSEQKIYILSVPEIEIQ